MNANLSTTKKLLSAFVSPAQFDFWSREVGSTVAWNRCFARVVERKLTARNTVCLTLKPNGNFSGFQPGQHVNVSVDIQGVRLSRSYSLSNIPAADGRIELTIRAEEDGVVSSWLNNETKVGSVIELGVVFGDMTLPSSAPEQLLLLAAGSGITAIMSLLRHAVTVWPGTPVTLLYWDKTSADFCFTEELAALVECHPQL
ncbi:MAG: FAD-binding oxidoreductase, partial [Spongiibacteraceae bacterium]